jgi:hypothetical protein
MCPYVAQGHDFFVHVYCEGFDHFQKIIKTIKRFCMRNLNYFQMHLGFLIVFEIIHVYADSFVVDRVWP